MGYQPRSKLVKGEYGNLLADSHNISNRCKNHFSRLPNDAMWCDIKQTEARTTELLVPNPSSLDVETAVAMLKRLRPNSSRTQSGKKRNSSVYDP
jgi:hypothetical protein